MLNQYIIELDLPPVLSPEFTALIPAQRAKVNELMHNGDIRSYALAIDRARLWVVMIAKDELHLRELLAGFPIIDFCQFTITELLFHDMASHELPRMSMN